MQIIKNPHFLEITSGEGRLVASKTNRGEPYREGADLAIWMGEYDLAAGVFLETAEAIALRDFLLRLYPLTEKSS
jgi:hypothetical protein